MEKPTIVLVPDAWHTPEHFEAFEERLNEAGYPTVCMPLSSVDSDEPHKESISLDALSICYNILPDLHEGNDVIVVAHSYGGGPGAAVADGMSKKKREADGLRGGVIGLILVCGFILHRRQTPLDMGNDQSSFLEYDEETGQLEVMENAREIFYNEVADSALVEKAFQAQKPQSLAALLSRSPPPAWADEAFDGRRAYVFTHKDKAMPLAVQKTLVSKTGKVWRELELEDADHFPFMSRPEPLFKFIDELAREWTE